MRSTTNTYVFRASFGTRAEVNSAKPKLIHLRVL